MLIVPSAQSVSYGETFELTCETHALQSKRSLTNPLIEQFLTVEWTDINNVPIAAHDHQSITVGEVTSNFSRTLHFNPVMKGHDRLYKCVAALKFPSGAQFTNTTEYRLLLGKEYLQSFVYLLLSPMPSSTIHGHTKISSLNVA